MRNLSLLVGYQQPKNSYRGFHPQRAEKVSRGSDSEFSRSHGSNIKRKSHFRCQQGRSSDALSGWGSMSSYGLVEWFQHWDPLVQNLSCTIFQRDSCWLSSSLLKTSLGHCEHEGHSFIEDAHATKGWKWEALKNVERARDETSRADKGLQWESEVVVIPSVRQWEVWEEVGRCLSQGQRDFCWEEISPRLFVCCSPLP